MTDDFVTKYNSAGTKQFTRQLGVSGLQTFGNAIAVDALGEVYVVGSTYGGLDGNVLTGVGDFFLTKYDSTGTKLFTKQLGVASQITNGAGVVLDSGGNAYVTGYTGGALDGNTRTGIVDFFLTKYNSRGVKQYTKQLGVASAQTIAAGIAIDASSNLYVTGYTQGGLDGNSLTGIQDFFVTEFNSSGIKLFTRQLGVSGVVTSGSGVTVDSSGTFYVTGLTFGGLDGNTLTGTSDFFVTQFNSNGVKKFTRQYGVSGQSTSASAVTVDTAGNVNVTGRTSGGLDGNTIAGITDFFITQFNSSGVKQFTRQLGVFAQTTNGNGVAVDSSANIFIGGSTSGGLNGNTVTGTSDFFVSKYSSKGIKY